MIIYVTICSIYDSRFMVTYCLNNQWHYFARFEPFSTFSLLHFQYVTKNVIIEHQNINFLILDRVEGKVRYGMSSPQKLILKLNYVGTPFTCLTHAFFQNKRSNCGVKSNMTNIISERWRSYSM